MASPEQDSVDRHVARWLGVVDSMDPEVEGAVTRMGAILRHLRVGDQLAYADQDGTLEDFKTLHALMIQPYPEEATPAQLADACHVTRAAMTSRLDRLVERDHVTREVDPLDRRRIIVRPTPAGRQSWERGLRGGIQRERDTLAPLDQRDLVALNALLRKVVRHIEGDA